MADAPGWPGIEARWTSSAKIGVGRTPSPVSRVWFTVSHGILNEIYSGSLAFTWHHIAAGATNGESYAVVVT